ncbi:hypothetical protein NBRC111894_3871 [Sporolactobacillus inulinus]|uniref:Uncharacterized protein n=1 Tax=Sporolactobacillus inulinus TaxID=2078 RepID=A0A4Y1ZIP3_9BACL|nr:hypothetical protein NBRC111894_3782 [Sporolactobacillus inulinus]GAY78317.1 hypothetical protein NBRC111894_3871 [Sporolactobacillus inulinus]
MKKRLGPLLDKGLEGYWAKEKGLDHIESSPELILIFD